MTLLLSNAPPLRAEFIGFPPCGGHGSCPLSFLAIFFTPDRYRDVFWLHLFIKEKVEKTSVENETAGGNNQYSMYQ